MIKAWLPICFYVKTSKNHGGKKLSAIVAQNLIDVDLDVDLDLQNIHIKTPIRVSMCTENAITMI